MNNKINKIIRHVVLYAWGSMWSVLMGFACGMWVMSWELETTYNNEDSLKIDLRLF